MVRQNILQVLDPTVGLGRDGDHEEEEETPYYVIVLSSLSLTLVAFWLFPTP